MLSPVKCPGIKEGAERVWKQNSYVAELLGSREASDSVVSNASNTRRAVTLSTSEAEYIGVSRYTALSDVSSFRCPLLVLCSLLMVRTGWGAQQCYFLLVCTGRIRWTPYFIFPHAQHSQR